MSSSDIFNNISIIKRTTCDFAMRNSYRFIDGSSGEMPIVHRFNEKFGELGAWNICVIVGIGRQVAAGDVWCCLGTMQV
jgi:hypothetical protein